MGIVSAKCPQCGANLNVDSAKDAGICPSCGTAFITEKAIRNYITHNTTNIENQTNIYMNESLFEKEKRECKVLLMLLNKLDLQYLKEQSLKVLSVNPENSLAKMIYDCGFCVEVWNTYTFLGFDEQPLYKFLEKECGNIDLETSLTFLKALLLEVSNAANVSNLISLIFKNLLLQKINNQELYTAYHTIALLIVDTKNINSVLAASKLTKLNGVLSMIDTGSYSYYDSLDAQQKKQLALTMLASRKTIAKAFCENVNSSTLSDVQKNDLITIVLPLTSDQNPNPPAQTEGKLSTWAKIFLILFIGIPLAVAIYFLFTGLK